MNWVPPRDSRKGSANLVIVETLAASKDDVVEKLKTQLAEATKKGSVLAMRLVTKDQEQQDLLVRRTSSWNSFFSNFLSTKRLVSLIYVQSQIAELKSAAVPGASSLRTHLVDPAVNYVFWSVKKEQEALKQKLEDTQSELSAWKFTPDRLLTSSFLHFFVFFVKPSDLRGLTKSYVAFLYQNSQRGKLLMAKCRQLLQENEELGKVISSGRLAKLEGDLALEKNFCKELKRSQRGMFCA